MSDQYTQRPVPDNTQHAKETATHARAGFEPADQCLRPRDHQDMPEELYC
jgi:hypothetical protein